MANNRMLLVNQRTGKKLLVAKWTSGLGWCWLGSEAYEDGYVDDVFDADFAAVTDTGMGTDSGPWAVELEHT